MGDSLAIRWCVFFTPCHNLQIMAESKTQFSRTNGLNEVSHPGHRMTDIFQRSGERPPPPYGSAGLPGAATPDPSRRAPGSPPSRCAAAPPLPIKDPSATPPVPPAGVRVRRLPRRVDRRPRLLPQPRPAGMHGRGGGEVLCSFFGSPLKSDFLLAPKL